MHRGQRRITALTLMRSALKAGGATIGVVASGVDVSYPASNARLIGEIAEHGLLIGELPPGDHPTSARFVLRNRVNAASLGLVSVAN